VLASWAPRSEWKITPGGRVTVDDRHAEGIDDEVRAHIVGQREPDDPARGAVDHRLSHKRHPVQVLMYVASPTQARFGAARAKSQASRSDRLGSNRPGRVVRLWGRDARTAAQPRASAGTRACGSISRRRAAQLVVDPAHADPPANGSYEFVRLGRRHRRHVVTAPGAAIGRNPATTRPASGK
jgi:hypothetical protein